MVHFSLTWSKEGIRTMSGACSSSLHSRRGRMSVVLSVLLDKVAEGAQNAAVQTIHHCLVQIADVPLPVLRC